jgi:hypothetical protein
MMKVDVKKWRQWQAWIQAVKDDLSGTVDDQASFREFADVVRQSSEWINSHQGDWFVRFVVRCYVARTALGLRRHLKEGDNNSSLVGLLRQIEEGAKQLTFDFYLSRFPRDPQRKLPWQEVTFGRLSEDGQVVSSKVIAADVAKLKALTRGIEGLADRALAHLDQRGFDGVVTFADVRTAVAGFDEIVCKYLAFLVSDGYSSLEAVPQFNVTEVFRHPLMRPDADGE